MRNYSGTAAAAAREVFEGAVGIEAVARAGRNPQLKGIVHEVAYKDMYNLSPERLVDGNHAVLSHATNAVRDDVLIKNGGKIVQRIQLKDTSSTSGIAKTVSQVGSKHYAGTNLMGTPETAARYTEAVGKAAAKGKQVTQQMSSTGISSGDTARIAAKTIGTSAGKLTAQALGNVARSSGAAGALLSGGIELINSGVKLANYEIDGGEFMGNVVKETVGGGVSAAGAGVAATAAATGVATALAATTAPVWVPAAVGVAAAVAAGSAIKNTWDKICDEAELFFLTWF